MFIGFVSLNQGLYSRLQESGFILNFKPTIPDDERKIKGNVDADLVLQAMIEWNNYDKAVIISSDGDFYSLARHLNENGKLSAVISSDIENCSSLLKKVVRDKIQFMYDLKNKLQYINDKHHLRTKTLSSAHH
jgi:uncharacterized LabA/DUF88 family protein